MPSSKGRPTDPELREELKEEIKQEPNKSGGGQGQWSAWKVWTYLLMYRQHLGCYWYCTKASKLAKEYEKQGGDYENEAGSKNEPKPGEPQHKSEGKKSRELEEEWTVSTFLYWIEQ